ncbi:DsbA family protein [Alterisphingorhabdus coralli]|uniref:DsbA family protein n=1 Tax=Alterisphingorhabdus coralli TaxID=3071408 RepID=A0AA97F5R2_9SPHN|nr:DsbA family protein [Parasphingorhabdus sp. SCSIO 66989]WOE74829.1 DsbA family protein [Parasphingorhabdus sp. SCSIO 66989]
MSTGIAVAVAAGIGIFMWQGGSTAATETDKAARAAGINAEQQEAFEEIVRQYILDNPEIIPEAIDRLRAKQAAERIDGIRDQIEKPFEQGFAGNPNGDVVLVEFSDFACGYCRQSVGDVARLLSEDPNLKVVFRELPILSDASGKAAQMALAAANQDRYYSFHKAMFDAGRPSDQTIEAAAKSAGMDLEAAKAFISTPAAQAELESNIRIAQQLEFTGTPSWVIGNQIFSGAVGYDQLKAAIEAERANGKTDS